MLDGIFTCLIAASFVGAIARYIYLRGPRSTAASEPPAINDASAIYSGRAYVREQTRLQNWFDWHPSNGGGPMLIVRPGSFQVVAPQRMMLTSRDVEIQSTTARMWLDKVGWGGTPLGRKECIHVSGRDRNGWPIDFALSPHDGLQDAWRALTESGVKPCAPAEGRGPGGIRWRRLINVSGTAVGLGFIIWIVLNGGFR